MQTYCWKCLKDTENVNSKVLKNKNGKPLLLSKCAAFGSKKSIFMKEQKAKGLLNSLGLKTPLSNIPLFAKILF